MNALEWAVAFLREGVSASAGHDRGPVVDDFEEFMHLPLGSPWCAAFVSYCFHKAETDSPGGNPFPVSGSSQELYHHFSSLGLASEDPQAVLSWKGALAGWTDADDSSHGHIFFVEGRLTDAAGRLTELETVEGNAGPGAVVSLRRAVPVTAEGHKLWFLNVSGFTGGNWF